MIRLAAFADEIDPKLDVQIEHCKKNGVTHIELRGVDGQNVLDFSPEKRKEIKSKLDAAGMGVAAIGSPIGKVAIDASWPEHFDRYKVAVESAVFFDAPMIRLFSYYPPGGEGKGAIEPHRHQILERFRAKIEYLDDLPVTLVHENEKGIYGEKGKNCLDLMQAINSPKLRSAFDFANFVQAGERPRDNWPLLKPFTTHIHIKDAKLGTGQVVPAGQGDGDVDSILADAFASGYSGFLSLEPHLKVAGHSHGETGPELFKTAADALKVILNKYKIVPGK